MKKPIIISGPQGSGKTTLMRHFRRHCSEAQWILFYGEFESNIEWHFRNHRKNGGRKPIYFFLEEISYDDCVKCLELLKILHDEEPDRIYGIMFETQDIVPIDVNKEFYIIRTDGYGQSSPGVTLLRQFVQFYNDEMYKVDQYYAIPEDMVTEFLQKNR